MIKIAKIGQLVRILLNSCGAWHPELPRVLRNGDLILVKAIGKCMRDTHNVYVYACPGHSTSFYYYGQKVTWTGFQYIHMVNTESINCKFLNIEKIKSMLTIENNSFLRTNINM